MTPALDLLDSAWPADRLAEAMVVLARASGLAEPGVELPLRHRSERHPGSFAREVEAAAESLGLEARPTEVSILRAGEFLRSGGPALLRVPANGSPRFLLSLGQRSRATALLLPDRSVRLVRPRQITEALADRCSGSAPESMEELFDEAGISPPRRAKAGEAIRNERLRHVVVPDSWLLRAPAGAPFARLVRLSGLPRVMALFIVASLAEFALLVLSWWMVGKGALEGRLDWGWIGGWALVLFTIVPVRFVNAFSQGRFSVGLGELLRKRLMAGAMRIEPDQIRHEGAGQLLGRVIESEAVEAMALQGGFQAALSGLQLLLAAVVLFAFAGNGLAGLLLLGWMGVTLLLGWRYFRARRLWTAGRLELTHDLVERMVGHRTRLAQEPRARWHEAEDQSLEGYLRLSKSVDAPGSLLAGLIPRGWLMLGLSAIAWDLFISTNGSPARLAVGLGGVLLAFRVFDQLGSVLWNLAGAAAAWERFAPLLRAAARPGRPSQPDAAAAARTAGPLLQAKDLAFRHLGRSEPVLRGCSLQIDRGERLLLTGFSGSGKSTLVSIMAGQRRPDSGLLLLDGLDHGILGREGWRRRVALAPQFHENHVFTETFAFNLLMGRGWPPRAGDLEEAEAICHELGLGPLLERMPAGLFQMLGESGWQLSHGERGRLFVARALLQEAELVILDESLGALDPETFRTCLSCIRRRAPSLLLIAHP